MNPNGAFTPSQYGRGGLRVEQVKGLFTRGRLVEADSGYTASATM